MKITWEWHAIDYNAAATRFISKEEHEEESALALLNFVSGLTTDVSGVVVLKNLQIGS